MTDRTDQYRKLTFRVWSKDPDMADWTAFAGVAANPKRQELFSVGGYHPRNTGPWPTEHIYSDAIASMNYKTVSYHLRDSDGLYPYLEITCIILLK
jgi:hypothetical protein